MRCARVSIKLPARVVEPLWPHKKTKQCSPGSLLPHLLGRRRREAVQSSLGHKAVHGVLRCRLRWQRRHHARHDVRGPGGLRSVLQAVPFCGAAAAALAAAAAAALVATAAAAALAATV